MVNHIVVDCAILVSHIDQLEHLLLICAQVLRQILNLNAIFLALDYLEIDLSKIQQVLNTLLINLSNRHNH